MDQKLGAVPLLGRGLIPNQHNVAWAEAYLHAKFHLDPFNRLATNHNTDRVTHRRDRQRSDSIGRSVLQTVAQKASTKPVTIECVAHRLDNFVVGLTNDDPATTAPVFKSSYTLCGQWSGSVGHGATATINCAPSDEKYRYVIIQGAHAGVKRAICLAEVAVYLTIGK